MAITHGFTANLGMLLSQACPTDEDVPFFNDCMKRARANGLSWDDSLRYTISVREQLEQGEVATPFELAPQKRIGWGGSAVPEMSVIG
jgi:hypothetical protein